MPLEPAEEDAKVFLICSSVVRFLALALAADDDDDEATALETDDFPLLLWKYISL